MGNLYLKDGAYFDLTKGSPEQLEIFLESLRNYGCTNVPSEPTGEMRATRYVVYHAGLWPRKSRMVLSNGWLNDGTMQYEVVPPDVEPKPQSAPSKMSRRARLRTILAMVEAELVDTGSDDDE